jgi:WD40 repeat protein
MSDMLATLDQRVIAVPRDVNHLAYSPDGTTLAIATSEGPVVLLDLESGAVSSQRGPDQGLVWSTRGLVAIDFGGVRKIGKRSKRTKVEVAFAVAAVAQDSRITLYDGDAIAIGAVASDGYRPVVSGGTLAVITREHVEVYDAATQTLRARHAIDADLIALSPDGSRLLARGHCGAWEGPAAGPFAWYPERGVIAHDGTRFAIGGAIHRVGSALPELRVPVSGMGAIAFAPDGASLAIGMNAHVRILDLAALAAWPAPVGPEGRIANLAVDRERRRIAAIDESGLVCVWRDAVLEATWRVSEGKRAIAFARDGGLLVGTHGLEVWDVATRERRAALPIAGLREIAEITTSERCLAVRDSERIAILELDYTLRKTLWATDERLPSLEAIALSPDGHRLGVARRGAPALLLDPADGSTVRELPEADAIAVSATLLACSTYQSGTLAALDANGEAEEMVPFRSAVAIGDAFLWHSDRRAGLRARHEVRLDVGLPTSWSAVSAAVASDRFVTATRQWVAERTLADAEVRRILAGGAQGKITSLAFAPSGEHLAAGEQDGRLHVWRLGPTPERIGLLDGTTLQPTGTIREPGRVGEISALTFTSSELVACATEVLAWPIGALTSIGTTEPRAVPHGARRISRDGRRIVADDDWRTYAVYAADGTKLSTGDLGNADDRFDDLSDDGLSVLVVEALETASELSVVRDTGEPVGTLHVDGKVRFAGFDARGRVVGALAKRGPYFRWDPTAGRVERWCDAPSIELSSLKLVARAPGRIMLEAGSVHVVVDESTGAILATIAVADDSSVSAAALSADGRRVAIGTWKGQVRLYDLDPAHPSGARCFAALAGTSEGGWWAIGAHGFTHVAGDATTHKLEDE